MKGRYQVTIKGWHPALLNRLLSSHWAQAARLKASDRLILAAELNAKVPKATGKRRVEMTWVMASRNRQPDADGVWKSLLDALVKGGYLKDDSPAWCELAAPVFTRGPVKGIVLTLEDVEVG